MVQTTKDLWKGGEDMPRPVCLTMPFFICPHALTHFWVNIRVTEQSQFLLLSFIIRRLLLFCIEVSIIFLKQLLYKGRVSKRELPLAIIMLYTVE